jgi:hypothetical protein
VRGIAIDNRVATSSTTVFIASPTRYHRPGFIANETIGTVVNDGPSSHGASAAISGRILFPFGLLVERRILAGHSDFVELLPATKRSSIFCNQEAFDIRKLIESGTRPKRSRFRADAPIPSVLEKAKRHPARNANCNLTFNKAVCTPLRRCTNRQLVVRR